MQHSNCSTCISSFNPHTNQKRDRLVDCHFPDKVTTYREIEEPAQCHPLIRGRAWIPTQAFIPKSTPLSMTQLSPKAL